MSSDSQELFFIFSYNKNAENNGNRDGNENIKRRRMALFHIIKRICSFASSIVWSVFILGIDILLFLLEIPVRLYFKWKQK